MNQLPIPHRPPSQVERELAQARNAVLPPLPNIGALQAAVSHWTTEATLDPEHKPALQAACEQLRAANIAIAERGRHNLLVDNLTKELEQAQAARRLELATQADDNLGNAIGEYRSACLVAARALRTLLNAQHASAATPGAQSNISALRVELFAIPHLTPLSNHGTLGTAMLQGAVGFEQQHDFGIRPNLKVA